MTDENDAPEVVASVGPLDAVVVLLREFLHRSGAVRAVAVVEGEPGDEPAIVDVRRLYPTEVEIGDRTVLLPHAVELDVPAPALPAVRQLAPFDVDVAAGEIAAPPGGVAHLASAVRGVADLLGGRNVAHGPVRDERARGPARDHRPRRRRRPARPHARRGGVRDGPGLARSAGLGPASQGPRSRLARPAILRDPVPQPNR